MKIRTTCTLIILLGLAVSAAHSQEYKKGWHTRPSVGYHFPVTRLLKGELTDYLFEYDDGTFYWQVISASYFFHKHWGVEFNYQGGSSANISKRVDRFTQAIHGQWGQDYFVSEPLGVGYPEFNIILGHIERGFLGVVYRVEKNRLLLQPKLSIGVISFYTDWATTYLKEKGTNTVYELDYSTGRRPHDHLTASASGVIGYRLSDRVSVMAELMGSYYHTSITYTKTLTDKNTGVKNSEQTPYRNHIVNIGVGTGLIIALQ